MAIDASEAWGSRRRSLGGPLASIHIDRAQREKLKPESRELIVPINLQDLRPYKSFIVATVRAGAAVNGLINRILNELQNDVLRLGQAGQGQLLNRQNTTNTAGMAVGGLHYLEEKVAPWTTDVTVTDQHNHLALVCRRDRAVAILMTDAQWRSAILGRFEQPAGGGLAVLQALPQGKLNAAFVTGPTRTLWMTGTHRRTTIKPDSKTLTGSDLRDALDSLGDGSFYFNAARINSVVPGVTAVIGVSPAQSRVWVGPSRNWDEFEDATSRILEHVARPRRAVTAPLPILAAPSQDRSAVRRAYELGLVSPYTLDEGDDAIEARRELEAFAEEIEFRVTGTNGVNVNSRVYRNGTDLGSIDFTFDITRRDRVTWIIGGTSAGAALVQDYQRVRALCAAPRGWLKVWFESGHTLAGRALYSMRFRDVPFTSLTWTNFAGYDVTLEKPNPLNPATVGAQNSLFCWVKNVWPNVGAVAGNAGDWLACDDRSHEMADFIHLDNTANPPILSLLHAKGSQSNAANRTASLPHFETVLGQAIKNLRHLERSILAQGLRRGLSNVVANMVWQNRAPSNRNAMLAALNAIGANYRRRVVIVHPSLTIAEMTTPVAAMNAQRALRFRQVNMLLTAADVTCRGAGVEFIALGAQ